MKQTMKRILVTVFAVIVIISMIAPLFLGGGF